MPGRCATPGPSPSINRWSWSLIAANFSGAAGHYEIRIKGNGTGSEAKSGIVELLPAE